MIVALLFLVIFILGPVSFRAMTARAPSQWSRNGLAVLAGVCALAGLLLRFLGSKDWGSGAFVTIAGIALLWFGWIAILAFMAQTLRRSDPRPAMRRWTSVVGYGGTTAPWFGLVLASAVSG